MKINFEQLQKSRLFFTMTKDETETALNELHAQVSTFKKGARLLHAGDKTKRMALVLSGSVTIETNDPWGNRTILSHVSAGDFFAETYAFLSDAPLLVDVVANEPSRILFLTISHLSELNKTKLWVIKLITNLLHISMQKNLMLSQRSTLISPKTIRARITAYLHVVAVQKNSYEFDIPFDRQQLADYLNVERTALSKELGKMQRNGNITVKKNHFTLHTLED